MTSNGWVKGLFLEAFFVTGMNFHHPAPIMCNQWFLTDKEFSPLAFFNVELSLSFALPGPSRLGCGVKKRIRRFFQHFGYRRKFFSVIISRPFYRGMTIKAAKRPEKALTTAEH
ncbi:hypothetical protein [Bowmanella denitrificans]|uniref:hypothetical protein n=1 Tax=Bowmanella denitrificans TaxID=366582 RepID=UPI000C9B2124|nr:hypothetical protein [Bowmanella denitrificans]